MTGSHKTVFDALATDRHAEHFEPELLSEPTSELPGTTAKVEVLRRRVAAGEQIWNPDDRMHFDEGDES